MNNKQNQPSVKYHYSIIYAFTGGIGRIFVWTDQKIDTEKTMKDVEKIITRDTGNANVFIRNLILLEGDVPPQSESE